MMTLFYRQREITTMRHFPTLDIPDSAGTSQGDECRPEVEDNVAGRIPSSIREADVFVALCRFWRIMYDVATAYYQQEEVNQGKVSLQFAEFKFRELLAWTDDLPLTLARSGHNPHYVMILQYVGSSLLAVKNPDSFST